MKTFLIHSLTAILFAFSIPAISQTETVPTQVSNVFKLNFFSPRISYEQKLSRLTTLHGDVYMDALLLTAKETSSNHFHAYFTPSFKTEVRTYYNLRKRQLKGLRTAQNSANYIAPLYNGRYTPISDFEFHQWINQAGVVWGFQRNSSGGFSLDVNMGLIYTFNAKEYFYYDPLNLTVQVRLGIWLGKKRV